MTPLLEKLIEASYNCQGFFFKYIAANDTGTTGSHQAGFYMPRDTWPLFFDAPGQKGENRDLWIRLHWPDGHLSQSRYIWYGRGTRAEYRLTHGFNFLNSEQVGDLLVLIRQSENNFAGFMLSGDEIDDFFTFFNLSPEDSCRLQSFENSPTDKTDLDASVRDWLATQEREFPTASSISEQARQLYRGLSGGRKQDADTLLLSFYDSEFLLFRHIEKVRYSKLVANPLGSVDRLVSFANTVLNRRKARAGYALENHLYHIFSAAGIDFSHQASSEGRKKPDFIFPRIEAYHDPKFPSERLTFLAVKTTAKDRWRQILSEADRIPDKYLFTLQQGISEFQMNEMAASNVHLVVPERYRRFYPAAYQKGLLSLTQFMELLQSRQTDRS